MYEFASHKMASEESDAVDPIVTDNSSGIEGEVFERLKAVFLASGKGRRPKLPAVVLTDQLLLQTLLLREQGHKTYDEAALFLNKLFPDVPVPRLRYMLVSANVKKDASSSSCLSSSSSSLCDTDSLGPYLEGISRKIILEGHHVVPYRSPSCGLLKDLLTLKRKEGKTFKDVCMWWVQLTGTSVSESCMTKAAAKFQKINSSLQPSAHRPAGKEKYTSYLESSPFPSFPSSPPPASSSSSSSAPPESRPTSCSDQPDFILKLAEGAKQLYASRRREEELCTEVNGLKFKISVLTEVNKDNQVELCNLRKTNRDLVQTCTCLEGRVGELEAKIKERNDRVVEISQKLNYARDKGVEKKLKRRDEKVEALETQLQATEETELRLREDLRKLQVSRADVKQQLEKVRRKYEAEIEKNNEHVELEEPGEEGVIRLKNEMGHFKREAKVAIMTLMGECEVPAHRCGPVIKTVVELSGARVPDSDLPSQRTALRFADQVHVISKAHVAETLLKSDHWDLHVDGTSRSGVKYVCQQITTSEGTLSLGFIPVATEDTTTLVDVTIQMLEEISDIYSGEEAQQVFVQMLISLTSIMSDRAAVMKSFGRSLQEERRMLIQTDEGLEFLHCNAHYLLGLGAECKKVLTKEEKESGEKLGRDALPRFSSYNKATECSAFRYVRTACDILGPRGDDKNGMRDCWEAYCLTVGRRSAVTSFRENRFNNLFQAAAGLHYHRHDIQDCIDVLSQVKKLNGKIESVSADNASDVIDNHIITLGLLYFRITGPYWSLLGASVHYLDFFNYVGRLHRLLMAWSQDASPALDANCEPIFLDINFHHDGDILQSLLTIGEEKKAAVTTLLQKVCAGLVEVTERQLADFLPQGRYYNIQDPALYAKLQHSHVTNLVSEQNFADLDFSLFKRRNSSLHHHSTVNMLKRNRSVTSWLKHKPIEEQTQILQLSSQKASTLRKKHVMMERDAVRQKKVLLQQARQKKEAADEKKRQKVLAVIDDLKPHQGPCRTPADVDRLLAMFTTDAGLKKALRAEIFFHKLVLSETSPHLKVTGPSLTLVNRLLQFIGGQVIERLPRLRGPPPAKRPRRELFECEPDNEEEEDDEEDVRELEVETEFDIAFQFQRVGEIVAVYYEDTFYIGEVTELGGDEEAEVNFMERTKDGAIFRWPVKEDRCSISADVVFAGNLALAPSSSSGRAFIVEAPHNLGQTYRAFKAYLIENVL